MGGGYGSPLADPSVAGELVCPASDFTIAMGVFEEESPVTGPGDLDMNGAITENDMALFSFSWLDFPWSGEDFNFDGKVDFLDHEIMMGHASSPASVENLITLQLHDGGLGSTQVSIAPNPIRQGPDIEPVSLTVNFETVTNSISVLSPNGGEQLEGYQNFTIRWNSSGSVSQVNLEYSADSGANWTPITSNENNDGDYSWQVPDINSNNCLIRVSDSADSDTSDISNNDFSITERQPATLLVPYIFPKIQSAVNVAINGDTVLCSRRNIHRPKATAISIFLESPLPYAVKTVRITASLICQGSASEPHRGFYIHNNEVNAVIEGFTVTNGYALSGIEWYGVTWNFGGGILCESGSTKISKCIIHDNTAHGGGGILTWADASVEIDDCKIFDNTTFDYDMPDYGDVSWGGGVFCYSDYTISNSMITGNEAKIGGGIVVGFPGTPPGGNGLVSNCVIANNTSRYGWCGGVYNGGPGLSLVNCTIVNNYDGGYSSPFSSSPSADVVISNCILWA